jgi:hypothetical protein
VISRRGDFMNRTHTEEEREEAYAKRGPRIPKTQGQLNTAKCIDETLIAMLAVATETGTDGEKTSSLESIADDNEVESRLLDELFEIGGVTRNASLSPEASASTPAEGRDWHKLRTKTLEALEPKYRSRADRADHSPSITQTFCVQIITLATILTQMLPTLKRANATTRSRRAELITEADGRRTKGLTPELLHGYTFPENCEYDNDVDEPTPELENEGTRRQPGLMSLVLRPLVGTEDPPREGVG